jgi:hypothetical protein
MRKLVPSATVGKRFDQLFGVSVMGSTASAPSGWTFKESKEWADESASIRYAGVAESPVLFKVEERREGRESEGEGERRREKRSREGD